MASLSFRGAEALRMESKGTPLEHKAPEPYNTIVRRVEELAKKYDKKMSQIAIVRAVVKITDPIVGFISVERVQASLIIGFELTAGRRFTSRKP